jgi:hypothetical protein
VNQIGSAGSSSPVPSGVFGQAIIDMALDIRVLDVMFLEAQ